MGNRGESKPHSSTFRRLVTGGLLGAALSAGGMERTAHAEDTSYLSVVKKTEAESKTHLEAADRKSRQILEKYHHQLDKLAKDIKLHNPTTFQMNTRVVPLGFYLAQGIIIGEDEFVDLRGHANTDDEAACDAICAPEKKGVIDRFDRAKKVTLKTFEGSDMPKGYEEQEKMFANNLSFLEVVKIFAENEGLRGDLTLKIEIRQLLDDRGYEGPNALAAHFTITDTQGRKSEFYQNTGWLGQEQVISAITSKIKDKLNDLNKIKPAALIKK